MNRNKNKEIPIVTGKLYFTKDSIVKVCRLEQEFIYGYDLQSEDFIKVSTEELIECPKSINVVLKSEKVRLKVAREFNKTHKKIAESLGVSLRTMYRIKQELDV